MPEQRICENCGKEFRSHAAREVVCGPCELVFRAVEPPEILRDMRLVYSHAVPQTDGQRIMRTLFENDLFKFTERLGKLEDQYRAACVKWEQVRRLEAAPKRWDGKGHCPACGRDDGAQRVVKETGTVELIGQVEMWLNKQPEGEDG